MPLLPLGFGNDAARNVTAIDLHLDHEHKPYKR